MSATKRSLSMIVDKYRRHQVSTDSSIWYPQLCKFLKLNNNRHSSSFEKSIIERTMNYIIYRTESFDYFPYIRNKYKLKPVKQ